MKLAIIIGHTKKAQGATSYKGVSEYVWNGKVAQEMKAYAKTLPNIDVEVYTRDAAGVSGAAKLAKAWGADICMELHFNAFSKAAYGCEILVLKGDVESAKHADLLTDLLAKHYGFKERKVTQILQNEFDGDGVYETVSGNAGHGNLASVKAQGIPVRLLIEPCFMNTKNSESEKIHDDQIGYARLLVNYFAGVRETAPTPGPSLANWSGLVGALKTYNFEKLNINKDVILCQFILESGRGTSELFTRYYNAAGMKWRDDAAVSGAAPINYNASDGADKYAGFNSYVAFLHYYEKFIQRAPYKGYEDKIGMDYIKHIKNSGYAEDPNYVSKIESLLPEARLLLGEVDVPKPGIDLEVLLALLDQNQENLNDIRKALGE